MADISLVQARQLFTQRLIATYRERPQVTGFLRSFFRNVEGRTKLVSIAVQRGNEKVAVDVQRGTEGNRNEFTKDSLQVIMPPYYREFFDATDLDFYDLLFGQSDGTVNGRTFASWLDEITDKLGYLQDKIERAYEIQASQVLEDGIVTLKNGDNIDFKRKAASKVDNSGTPWTGAATDPIAQLEAGCNFLRQEGKSYGGMFNLILGSDALNALLNNAKFQARADIRRFTLEEVNMPQRNALGASLHGEIAVGAYRVRLWSYPQFYDNTAGESTAYINTKKVVMLPETPNFVMGFAAVPLLMRDTNRAEYADFIGQEQGAFVVGNYIDPRAESHIFDIKSAGITIPVAVDQIWTSQVVA